jgi:hypothetical protein
MSLGKRSDKAFEAALPVAMLRGEVMFFEKRPGSCFDFLVSGPGGTSAICVERALCIHGTAAGIAATYAGTIARMNASPLMPGFLRELWLWSPWGTMRYFRVESAGIIELNLIGAVRSPLVKGALAGVKRPRYRKSRKKSGEAAAMAPASGPEGSPATADGAQTPGTPGPAPGGNSVREPAPVRYLRKKAKEKEAREKEAQEKEGKEKARARLPADGCEPAMEEVPAIARDPATGEVPIIPRNPAQGEEPTKVDVSP